jgi:ankyrin repeat protein
MASTLRGNIDMVMTMLEHGADATVAEKDGYTPPHGAGFQGRPEVMRVLKEVGGIDVVNSPHADGFFPLHRACWGRERRHAETVEYLLSIGEDPNRRSTGDRKQTCLEMTRNPHTIEVLKKYGVSVESSGRDEM